MASDQGPLRLPPKGYDKDWRERIERAKNEREAAQKAREAAQKAREERAMTSSGSRD